MGFVYQSVEYSLFFDENIIAFSLAFGNLHIISYFPFQADIRY